LVATAFNNRRTDTVPAFLALLFSLLLGDFHLLSPVVTYIRISNRPRRKPKLRESLACRQPKIRFRSD